MSLGAKDDPGEEDTLGAKDDPVGKRDTTSVVFSLDTTPIATDDSEGDADAGDNNSEEEEVTPPPKAIEKWPGG